MDRTKWNERSWNWRWGIVFVVVCITIGGLIGWVIDKALASMP
jgi:hypothetical protein